MRGAKCSWCVEIGIGIYWVLFLEEKRGFTSVCSYCERLPSFSVSTGVVGMNDFHRSAPFKTQAIATRDSGFTREEGVARSTSRAVDIV